MRTRCYLSAILAGATAWAAVTVPPARQSQGFIVHDLRGPDPASANVPAQEGKRFVKLDLDELALSAERLKRALCRSLDLSLRGWGKLRLSLVSASEVEQNIVIASTRFTDGWQYRVEIPDQVEDIQLIRGIVEALLLELANRGTDVKSGAIPVSIPVWLTEGLAVHLRNSMTGADLIVQSVPAGSMLRSVRDLRGWDTLSEARSVLKSLPPATLPELGHPVLENLTGDNLKRYQSSAQLFVEELCRLPGGQACLVGMLRNLPACWNWETAFHRSFHRHFPRTLDLEKWWMVTLIGFTGRDPSQAWPPEICLEKLDEILLIPAQVRVAPDVMPVRTYVTPQQIIAEWDFRAQKPALSQAVVQLTALRSNCPLAVAPLVEGYRFAFQDYLQKRVEAVSTSTSRRTAGVSIPLAVRQTIERLDELYRRREALRREVASTDPSRTKP